MSDGSYGHGATLSIGGTTIGNIMTISGPNQSKDPIEISTMDSTLKFREFIPGMLDAGEITMEVNYDGVSGATANDLNNFLRSTATNLTIAINFGETTAAITNSRFNGIGMVTALGHAVPFDDKITQPITCKLTGVPTYTDQI